MSYKYVVTNGLKLLLSAACKSFQPVSQYVAVHEAALLEAAAGEPTDFFSSEVTSGKRRHEG